VPIFMDRHDLRGLKADDVAEAHRRDVDIQDRHGVKYMAYWFDENNGAALCLVHAPDPETAERVHRYALSLPSARITRKGVHPQIRLRVLVLSVHVGRCGQGRRRAATSSLAPAHMGRLHCGPRGGEVSRIVTPMV
jgi:hypothetical protein